MKELVEDGSWNFLKSECGEKELVEGGLRPLRAVGSIYEPEAIGTIGLTPRREVGKKEFEAIFYVCLKVLN